MRPWLISAVLAALLTGIVLGAEKKDPASVKIDELTKESQKTAIPDKGDAAAAKEGMNFVWFVPVEFWETSLLQNSTITKAQAQQTVDQMRGVFIVAVVRAKIQAMGQFDYIDEATVRKNLAVEYVDKAGKSARVQPAVDLKPATASILAALKPVMKGAMGRMGESMCFFVFQDQDAAGGRIVSPSEVGKLVVTLGKLEGEPGGKAEILFPLNALFNPRECPKCHQGNMDIQWHFCPYCGTVLKD